MKKTVKIIKIWAKSGLDSEFSSFSGAVVFLFCTRFACRDRRPSSGGPVDGQKSSSLKVFGFIVESV